MNLPATAEGFQPSIVSAYRPGRLRVMLIVLEFYTWWQARHVSYSAQLGLEEGLQANGVDCFTLTTPWLGRAPEICAGQHFDQVWIDIVQSKLGDKVFRDQRLLEWLADLAPVRVGFLPESLDYTPEEKGLRSVLRHRRHNVESRIKYLTHVVACDEEDAKRINSQGLVPAMWWPQAVPERLIREAGVSLPKPYAIFGGAVYGERAHWLKRPELKGLLVHIPPPESAILVPFQFETLQLAAHVHSRFRPPRTDHVLSGYLHRLRYIRRRAFEKWITGLQEGCAVVNLPHLVKTYAGRVVEGMAAGRPVISWDIPDRPRNRALFEDGREILLFPQEKPLQLVEHIQRMQREPDFARRLVRNAQRKLKRFHTLENRVGHILRWLETDEQPVYDGNPTSP